MKLHCFLPLLAAAFVAAAHADAAPSDGARELRFPKGRTRVTVEGSVVRGERAMWRFGAREGQRATITATSPEKNAVIEVWQPGTVLPATPADDPQGSALPGAGPGDGATEWSGTLPASGRYVVFVSGTRGNASYKLTLTIAP